MTALMQYNAVLLQLQYSTLIFTNRLILRTLQIRADCQESIEFVTGMMKKDPQNTRGGTEYFNIMNH